MKYRTISAVRYIANGVLKMKKCARSTVTKGKKKGGKKLHRLFLWTSFRSFRADGNSAEI